MTDMARTNHAAAADRAAPPVAILGSDAPLTCGVMDYARQLVRAINRRAPGSAEIVAIEPTRPLAFLAAIITRLRAGGTVHMQLPVEGWGNSVLPGLSLFLARCVTRRGRILMTLHEWRSLNALRYLSLVPSLLAADGFVLVSEQQREAFRRSPIIARAKRENAPLIPIGPNIMAADLDTAAVDAERRAMRGGEDILIGFFGVLYASKRPELLLEAVAKLRERGHRARLVVCGDFLHDKPQDRAAFMQKAQALGMADHLVFRGRIDDHGELMTVLAACDAYLLPYADGVSARRGTFHAVAQLARPIVTTPPERADEFAAFPELGRKVASLATVLVPAAATAEAFADGLVAALSHATDAIGVDLAGLWDEAADAHLALYAAPASQRPLRTTT